jgi:hypothetical protein
MKVDFGGPIPAVVLALSAGAGCGGDSSGPTSFTLACQPAVLAIDDSIGRVSCTATSVNAFAGTVLFRCASQPPGVACGFDPPTVEVPSGGSATTSLSLGPSLLMPSGPQTVQVAATGGGLSTSFDLGVNVSTRCSGFREQPSSTVDCRNRPAGTICWGFSDGYIWFVSDGFGAAAFSYTCAGQTVEVARGGSADYHHVLRTLYVKSAPPTR